MVAQVLRKIIGTRNDRQVRRMGRVAEQVNAHENAMKALSDEALRQKTSEFRQRHANGESL